MSWRNNYPLLVLLALLLAAPHAAAQQPAAEAGTITEDKTIVRAGGGGGYYPVGELSRGAIVTVHGGEFGWLKISPPQGVYSWIPKAYVDVRGDGKSGRVNQPKAAVKAAMLNGSPGDSYRRQVDLERGDTVQIVGEEGDFYKIVPPAGAVVYVPEAAVSRRGAAIPEAPRAPAVREAPAAPSLRPAPPPELEQPAATEPASPEAPESLEPAEPRVTRTPPAPATAPLAAERPAEPPAAPATPAARVPAAPMPEPSELRAASQAVASAEERLRAVQALPLEQQPLEELLRVYRQLQQATDLPPADRRIVHVRVAQLQYNMELAESIRRLSKVQEATGFKPTVTTVTRPEPAGDLASDWDAVGLLQASSVYDGTAMPRLFRLVTPGTGNTITYVQPGRNLDPSSLVGRVVGVMGEARYDPALKLRVMEAKRIEPLAATGARERAAPPAPPGAAPAPAAMPAPRPLPPTTAPAPVAEPAPEAAPAPAAEDVEPSK